MLNTKQKNQVFDIIPTSFVVSTIDSLDSVTFESDTTTEEKDAQIIETFNPEAIRYPSIQLQYRMADTRVNFMNFEWPDSIAHTEYQAANSVDIYRNLKDNPVTFDLTKHSHDGISQIGVTMRGVTNTTSYLVMETFEDPDALGKFKLIDKKMIYPSAVSVSGSIIYFTLTKPNLLNINLDHKMRLRSLTVGSNDLGLEVALDTGGDVVHNLYKPVYYENKGNVENLYMSIRVISHDKSVLVPPDLTKFADAQDIVDTITDNIILNFLDRFDLNVDDAEMVKMFQESDITEMYGGGGSERLAARQVDMLIANEKKLPIEYVPPVDVDLTLTTDSASTTL